MQFRLGSIPVTVRAPFFFMVLLLGGAGSNADPRYLLVWGVIVFVSVLAHELGHALAGKFFGLTPQIEIHGMGGTTSWTGGRDIGHARSIVISLAGPVIGLVVGGVIWLVFGSAPPARGTLGDEALRSIYFVNVVWGLFNLLPMLPLDGGNVLYSSLQIATKGRAEKPARVVSIVVAGLTGLVALRFGQLWVTMLCGLFAYSNIQGFRNADQRKADAILASAVEQAYRALDVQDGAAAIALLRAALSPHASGELRQIALRLLAYSLLVEEQWNELVPLLESERLLIGQAELERYAMTARELGRHEDAARISSLVGSLQPRMANDFGT